jgi:8-oxo-dGTP pyrophosphatase MutT (NUDIX family)
MASVRPGRYVVVVLHVGGTKLSDVKLVLQCEPRIGKTWFPVGYVTANEEHVDADVRELYEETGLILTPDDLTLLSDAPMFEKNAQRVLFFSFFCAPGICAARYLR